MHPAEYLNVMLLNSVVVHDDLTLEEGSEGTLIELLSSGYVVEFAIEDDDLVGGHRYETVVLGAEEFAVLGRIC